MRVGTSEFLGRWARTVYVDAADVASAAGRHPGHPQEATLARVFRKMAPCLAGPVDALRAPALPSAVPVERGLRPSLPGPHVPSAPMFLYADFHSAGDRIIFGGHCEDVDVVRLETGEGFPEHEEIRLRVYMHLVNAQHGQLLCRGEVQPFVRSERRLRKLIEPGLQQFLHKWTRLGADAAYRRETLWANPPEE